MKCSLFLCDSKYLQLGDKSFQLCTVCTTCLLLIVNAIVFIRVVTLDSTVHCNLPESEHWNDIVDVNAYCQQQNRFIPLVDHSDHCEPFPSKLNVTMNMTTESSRSFLKQHQDKLVRSTPNPVQIFLILSLLSLLFCLPYLVWHGCSKNKIKYAIQSNDRRLSKESARSNRRRATESFHQIFIQILKNKTCFTLTYLIVKLMVVGNIIIAIGLFDVWLDVDFIQFPLVFLHKNFWINTKFGQTHRYWSCFGISLANEQGQLLVPYPSNLANNPISTEQYSHYEELPKSVLCPYSGSNTNVEPYELDRIEHIKCLLLINPFLEQILLLIWVWLAILVVTILLDLLRYTMYALVRPLRRWNLAYDTNHFLDKESLKLGSQSFCSWLTTRIVIINNHVMLDHIKNYDPIGQQWRMELMNIGN